MKLSYQQLNTHLRKNLLSLYLITGNECLLVQESRDLIISEAKERGFREIIRYEVNKDFEWHRLEESESLSLFGDKTLVDLRLNCKPSTSTATILAAYIKKTHTDKILIISCDKLETSAQKTSWFTAADQLGAIITIWPLEAGHYRGWIEQRLKQHNLVCDNAAIDFLSQQNEGNLLALAQEIDKLKLLFDKKLITLSDMMNAIADNARYNIFYFIDLLLEGKFDKIPRILQRLRQEAFEPTLILWAITKEIRTLLNILIDLKTQCTWDVVANKYRLWDKRKELIRNCIKRLTEKNLHEALLLAQQIDHIIKGLQSGNIWDMLEIIAFKIACPQFLKT